MFQNQKDIFPEKKKKSLSHFSSCTKWSKERKINMRRFYAQKEQEMKPLNLFDTKHINQKTSNQIDPILKQLNVT